MAAEDYYCSEDLVVMFCDGWMLNDTERGNLVCLRAGQSLRPRHGLGSSGLWWLHHSLVATACWGTPQMVPSADTLSLVQGSAVHCPS